MQTAGPLAEEYDLSISDVMGLLALAGKDESLVRRALEETAGSDEARLARDAGRPFDIVAHARGVLKQRET